MKDLSRTWILTGSTSTSTSTAARTTTRAGTASTARTMATSAARAAPRGPGHEPLDLAADCLCPGLRLEAGGLLRPGQVFGEPPDVAGRRHHDYRVACIPDSSERRSVRADLGGRCAPGCARSSCSRTGAEGTVSRGGGGGCRDCRVAPDAGLELTRE